MAVKLCGLSLEFVPKHLVTPELCWRSVKDNLKAFLFVPNNLKTYKLCKFAVLNGDSWTLNHVPDKYKTITLCVLAVKFGSDFAYNFIPDKIMNDVKYIIKR